MIKGTESLENWRCFVTLRLKTFRIRLSKTISNAKESVPSTIWWLNTHEIYQVKATWYGRSRVSYAAKQLLSRNIRIRSQSATHKSIGRTKSSGSLLSINHWKISKPISTWISMLKPDPMSNLKRNRSPKDRVKTKPNNGWRLEEIQSLR